MSCFFTHTSSPLREASVRGLRAHLLYFYSVAAYSEKSHAKGNYSAWASTVMGAPLKPGQPVPPHIVSATCSSMNISISALSFEMDSGESPSKYEVMVLSDDDKCFKPKKAKDGDCSRRERNKKKKSRSKNG